MALPIPQAPECPPDATLVALLEERLSGPPLASLKAHVATCSACRALLDELTTGRTLPVHAFADAIGEALGRGASIGRYLVLSLIGRGGMGEVYAAYDPELDRRVALKLLHTARGSEEAKRRLVREARALGKLSHPNVVQVHDVGEHDGDVFVAMELVEGQSLDAWCEGPPKPGFREVLAAYLDAARGLEAAHEKALVHRDVKPSNILRGNDGRVRVVDFGLAAAAREGGRLDEVAGVPERRGGGDEAHLAETMPVTAGESGERLTVTGALVGTPLYMAPEQYEGADVGPASDQYSLCAALHEGLYGVRPFMTAPDAAGTPLDQLLARKREGLPASPPAGSSVPAWIHRVLQRGLAPRSEDRYPSLHALIAALGDDPEARRRARWRRAGLGAAAAALLAVAVAGWAKSGAFHDPCAHAERQLAGVWDEGVERRVRAAFLGTGRAHAEGTAARVAAILDRYAHDWAEMRGEVCEASRSGEQRREIGGLRDACLDRRMSSLKAITSLFEEKPDVDVVDKAVQAAEWLSPIAYCADTTALTQPVPPPEDPAVRARGLALQVRATQAEALWRVGKYKEGLALAGPLLPEAEAIAYPDARASVQVIVGRLREATGDLEGAKTVLREGAVSAMEARSDDLASVAWTRMLFVVGERQQRFEEAALIRSFGQVLVRTQDPREQAKWLDAEGLVLMREGDAQNKNEKVEEAKALFEQGLALREKVLGLDHTDVATSFNNLGNVLCILNDFPGARVMYERGVSITEKALGPDHIGVAGLRNNLGTLLCTMGDYPAALASDERALAIWEQAGDANAAYAVHNLGTVLYEMGDLPRARQRFEGAVAAFEKVLGPDHPNVATAVLGLGRTLVRLGQPEAALPLIDRARAVLGKDDPRGLVALGELALARRKPAEAVPPLEQAVETTDGVAQAEARVTLADALWLAGKDRAHARDLAEQARASFEKLGHRPGAARAARWLAEHAG